MPRRKRPQPVLACARCYSLKKKCDRKLPSCTRCITTGKECVAINRHSREEVPRSVLQYLEKRLADIEQERDSLPTPEARQTLRNVSKDPNITQHAYAIGLQSVAASVCLLYTTSCVDSHTGLLHESKLLYPTERPPHKLPVHGLYYEHLGKRSGDGNETQFSGLDALRIPFEVARRIFDNYVNTILPRYPCFTSNELWHHFGQVYSNQSMDGSSAPDFSRFIVSMVLAVGCLTSWRREFSRVAAMSEALYRDAIRHWAFIRESSIVSIQGILLLIQLGLHLPYINNIYFLSAEAVRMAVGLGLHQEVHPLHGLAPHDLGLRRQIFWMVYLVDRTIAISTGSPVCVSNEHITTIFPGNESNTATETCIPLGRPNAKHFLTQLQLCRLQSEIYEIKFFDRAIPDQFSTPADWVRDMEERIQDVRNRSVSADGELPQWIANAAYLSQNLLHRPYPGDMEPNGPSVLAATTSAINLINGYHKTSQTARLMQTFSMVDNAFQAAIVLLYIFGNYASIVREASLEKELVGAIDNLMVILDVGTQRWPVIAITSIYIRDLRDVVFSNQAGPVDSAHDIKLRKELELLLSQRRIRSIYQSSIEIQHAFRPVQLAPTDNSEMVFLDDMWQEFMDYDFGNTYSTNLLDSAWLVPGQSFANEGLDFLDPTWTVQGELSMLAGSSGVTEEVQTDGLPKDVQDAIDSLPSCSICRDQHVRCDRVLPCCGACRRMQRKCTYFDHILSQEVSRIKIHDMIQRLASASSESAAQKRNATSASPITSVVADPSRSWGINLLISRTPTPTPAARLSRDNSETVPDGISPDRIFFGVTSHLASICSVANPSTMLAPGTREGQLCSTKDFVSSTSTLPVGCPDEATASRLFAVFYGSVHMWYPVMDDETLRRLLSHCHTGAGTSPLTADLELTYLVLAISRQLTKKAEPQLDFTAAAYFQKATANVDTSCNHSSGSETIHMMQRSLLICIYLLLSPGQGDIWRNLGFAIRLYFDMSHGRFENLNSLDEGHLTMLARTLYCIESKIAVAFGRPTVLITGDKLRTDLTQPVRGTAQESLSVHFYQISTIRMQIQSLLISEASLQRNPGKLATKYEKLQQDLLDWQTSWTMEVMPAITRDDHEWQVASEYLETWGRFQYNAALLMLADSPESSFEAAKQVVLGCSLQARQHQRSFCQLQNYELRCLIPVFPMDWTTSHLILRAAILLLDPGMRAAANRLDWERTVRACFTTVALLEADPANLSMGFSEVLERLHEALDGGT